MATIALVEIPEGTLGNGYDCARSAYDSSSHKYVEGRHTSLMGMKTVYQHDWWQCL